VEHRLRKVGWQDRPQLDDAAFVAIHRHSGGIPRRINVLCSRALLGGWLADSDEISAGAIDEAAAELGAELAGEGDVAR
jgi:type II secretory pathway predicted ATPase ExeA